MPVPGSQGDTIPSISTKGGTWEQVPPWKAPKAYLKVVFVFLSPSPTGSLHNSYANDRDEVLRQEILLYLESQLTEKMTYHCLEPADREDDIPLS